MNPPQPRAPRAGRGVSRRGALDPELRRDLADLNVQYLQLGLTPTLADDARFAWAESVRRTLRESQEETLVRLAEVPLALFELAFDRAALAPAAPGVADSRLPSIAADQLARCDSLAQQAVHFARRLVDADGLAAGFELDMSVATRCWLAQRRPSELVEIARRPGLLAPRWRSNTQLWRCLIGAACRDSPTALQWACCIGVCLTGVGQRETPPAVPHRRPRR
jgi:hypothetical protein